MALGRKGDEKGLIIHYPWPLQRSGVELTMPSDPREVGRECAHIVFLGVYICTYV